MVTPPAPDRRAGFTLVELLLTVVMLLLLMGAMVFNFNRMQIGAGLDEGALRVQTLLRLADAEAAQKGRRVQLRFQPDNDPETLTQFHSFSLVWEPDPLQKPGSFEVLNHESWNVQSINDIVAVTQVLTREPAMTPPPANLDSAEGTTGDSPATLSPTYPPLTFYPDGTSDSIRLILASRTQDDARRIQLTWEGLTGTISIQPLSAYPLEDSLSMEETEERGSLWKDPTGLETESLMDNAN